MNQPFAITNNWQISSLIFDLIIDFFTNQYPALYDNLKWWCHLDDDILVLQYIFIVLNMRKCGIQKLEKVFPTCFRNGHFITICHCIVQLDLNPCFLFLRYHLFRKLFFQGWYLLKLILSVNEIFYFMLKKSFSLNRVN